MSTGDAVTEKIKKFLLFLPWFFLVLKSCYLFTVLYEIPKSFYSFNVHLTIKGQDDPKHSLYAFTVLAAICLLANITLISLNFINTLLKKCFLVSYVIFIFICVLPWSISGIYTTSKLQPENVQLPYVLKEYNLLVQTFKWNATNGTNSTDLHTEQPILNSKQKQLQVVYQCCELPLPEDLVEGRIPPDKKNETECPIKWERLVDPATGLQTIEYVTGSCEKSFMKRYVRFLYLCHLGLLFCCIIAILIAPFVYVTFEIDRRKLRAVHVYKWKLRTTLEIEQEKYLAMQGSGREDQSSADMRHHQSSTSGTQQEKKAKKKDEQNRKSEHQKQSKSDEEWMKKAEVKTAQSSALEDLQAEIDSE